VIVIRLPNGKHVSAGQYAAAWRYLITADPEETLSWFEWYAQDARRIREAMLRGLEDRINRHDRTMWRPAGRKTHLGARIHRKMDRAARAGRIPFWCRWCGADIEAKTYLQDHARFCDPSCRSNFYE